MKENIGLIDAKRLLKEFAKTVEATGGVFTDRKGADCPVGDPEWADLGILYVEVCSALNREPKRGKDPR